MPRLAIVISALGSIESLERTLLSVLENRPRDSEVIVALSHAYADPYALEGEVQFVKCEPGAAPIARVNRALAKTRAPFVHLLASGCEASEGWADAALARFGDRQLAAVAPLVYSAEQRQRIVAAGVGYRRSGARYLIGQGTTQAAEVSDAIVGPPAFAGFYRKAALDFVGGLSGQLGAAQADADLGLMLKQAGFTVALEAKSRVFASQDVDPRDSNFRKALYDERLFWRNVPLGGDAAALWAHAALVLIELMTSLPRPRVLAQIAGRTLAFCGSYRRHRRAMQQLEQRAVRPKSAIEHVRFDRSHDVVSGVDRGAARAAAH